MKAIFKSCLLIAILIMSGITVSAQKAMTPLEMNDNLSSITDSLYARGQQWGTQFNTAYKLKDFTSLKPQRENLERFVNANIARVTAMKDVKNSKPLRMAMIEFLKYEKKMIDEGFKPLEKLPSDISEDNLSKSLDHLKELSKLENEELKKVADAQEVYAESNGFKIEAAKEETSTK